MSRHPADDLARFQADPVVKDALERGVDLKVYSGQMTSELAAIETSAIEAYVSQAHGVACLDKEMAAVEGVLQNLQTMLQQFQNKLGGISSEIKTLQDESLSMNVQLKNRRAVHCQVDTFLDKVAVSEALIDSICIGQIDEEWSESLRALNRKLEFNSGGSSGHGGLLVAAANTLAGRDALPQLQDLKVKAIERSREWLLLQIAELRKGKTNLQKRQEYVLLRHQYLQTFLGNHAPEIALEIATSYEECMGRTLQSTFKTYSSELSALVVEVAGKWDMVATEEGGMSGFFSSKPDPRKRIDVFALKGRDSILQDPASGKLETHVEKAASHKVPFEATWKSLQLHLMDTATVEWAFCISFFGESRGPAVFAKVLSKPISSVLEGLENFLFGCQDTVAVLILLHLTQQHQHIMRQRSLDCLDSYFNRVLMLLWPKLKALLGSNLSSLGSVDESKIGPALLTAPHFIAQRYAEFVASILRLHRSMQSAGMSDDSVATSTFHSIGNLERMLQGHAAQRIKSSLERTVYVIVNMKHVCNVCRQRRCASDDLAIFDNRLAHHCNTFSQQLLSVHFGKLINFVVAATDKMSAQVRDSGAELVLDSAGLPEGAHVKLSAEEAASIVSDFASSWRSSMAQLNNTVQRYFGQQEGRTDILKAVLTALLSNYTKFVSLVTNQLHHGAVPARGIVALPVIFAEIKKYSRGAGQSDEPDAFTGAQGAAAASTDGDAFGFAAAESISSSNAFSDATGEL